MRYQIQQTSRFSRQVKAMKRCGLDLGRLSFVVDMLAAGEDLAVRYRNHKLSGNYQNCYECHIEPDWLLVYRKDNERLILLLVETGSHSDLFGK